MMEIWNEDLKAELKQANTDITAAAKRAEETCIQADWAARDASRQRRLAQKHLVAEEAHDNAETRARANRASCAASHATHAAVIARREVIDQQIEKTRLRAPFAGVIAEINTKLGEFITPSPTGIATLPAIDLIDTSCLYVSAPIDEVDSPQIKAGMPACVSLDAFKGKRCDATVRRVAPYVLEREKQARTVDVEVELKTPDSRASLLPGYSADIEILIGEKKDVLRIPTEALVNGHEVYVYSDQSHKLVKRAVQTGAANWEYTEILHGLSAGEQVVISVGRKGVKDGAFVKPDDGSDDAD